jgi:hypothetical protein
MQHVFHTFGKNILEIWVWLSRVRKRVCADRTRLMRAHIDESIMFCCARKRCADDARNNAPPIRL